MLTSAGRLTAGETVVVLAAAGGVGTAAGQLARILGGGHGDRSGPLAGQAEYARAFGYDNVVLYQDLERELADRTGGAGADLVLDSVGGEFRSKITGMLAPFGRHVVFGNAAAEDITFEGNHVWYTNSTLAGYNLGGVAGRAPLLLRAHLEQALAAVADGSVRIDLTVLPSRTSHTSMNCWKAVLHRQDVLDIQA